MRSGTGKPNVNQMVANQIDTISGELPKEERGRSKNPAVIELGRLGGRVGGVPALRSYLPDDKRLLAKPHKVVGKSLGGVGVRVPYSIGGAGVCGPELRSLRLTMA